MTWLVPRSLGVATYFVGITVSNFLQPKYLRALSDIYYKLWTKIYPPQGIQTAPHSIVRVKVSSFMPCDHAAWMSCLEYLEYYNGDQIADYRTHSMLPGGLSIALSVNTVFYGSTTMLYILIKFSKCRVIIKQAFTIINKVTKLLKPEKNQQCPRMSLVYKPCI